MYKSLAIAVLPIVALSAAVDPVDGRSGDGIDNAVWTDLIKDGDRMALRLLTSNSYNKSDDADELVFKISMDWGASGTYLPKFA